MNVVARPRAGSAAGRSSCQPCGAVASSIDCSATYGIGPTRSSAAGRPARSGASTRSPSARSPHQATRRPRPRRPCSSAGNGASGGAVTSDVEDASARRARRPSASRRRAQRLARPLPRVDEHARRARSGPTRWARNSKPVTTPKSPPPPRSAQNRSGCSSALARTMLAVGEHDLGRRQRVDRQAVAAHQPAEPAAEREPADAGVRDLAGRARPGRAPASRRRARPAARRRRRGRAPRAGRPRRAFSAAQVDAERAVAHRAPGDRVAAGRGS